MRRASLLLLLALLACRKEDPIAAVIHQVASAAEERDADAVVATLASNYSDANGGRAETANALRRWFFVYRSVDVSIKDLQTFQNGPLGQARFRADFSGTAREIGGIDQILPSSASYQFEVWLVEEGGDWKITAARWQAADRQLQKTPSGSDTTV